MAACLSAFSPSAEYEEVFLTMEAGDRLFIASDGLTETENPRGDTLGDDGLQAICTNATLRGDALLESICWSVCELCRGQAQRRHLGGADRTAAKESEDAWDDRPGPCRGQCAPPVCNRASARWKNARIPVQGSQRASVNGNQRASCPSSSGGAAGDQACQPDAAQLFPPRIHNRHVAITAIGTQAARRRNGPAGFLKAPRDAMPPAATHPDRSAAG